MTDSTSVAPFVQRWTRRTASYIGRILLALVSALVLGYGMIQLLTVMMAALAPMIPSPLAVLSMSEIVHHIAANYPTVQVGPVTVDPVLDPTALQTVGITVGSLFIGFLGITVAGTAPQLRQRTSTARENGLSTLLPSLSDFFLFGKSRGDIIHDAGVFAMQTVVWIFMGWTAAEILVPMVADTGAMMILLLTKILVHLVPVVIFICAIAAVFHVVWYAGLRWRGARGVSGGDVQ